MDIKLQGPYVHTKPEEFENAALFLRLGLTSTLICHENALETGEIWKRSFISMIRPTVHTNPSRKRSWNRRNLKSSFISMIRPTVHTNPSRKRSWNRRNLKTQLYFYG